MELESPSGLKVTKGLNEVPATNAPGEIHGDEDPEVNQATSVDEEGQDEAANDDEEEVKLEDSAFEEVKL